MNRIAFVLCAVALVACSKKADDAPATKQSKQAVVDRALATAQGTAVQAGKGAIVAQECALNCQAKPGIDPGQCTPKCVKDCANENDTASIDACARRVADESPQL